jgi:predicted nucleotidyltransferase
MPPIVKEKLDEIISICRIMQLKSLYLFGSGARTNDFQTDSDLDFLFRFQTNEAGFPLGGYDYFDLLFNLEQITGKKVDLVAEEKIRNRFFLESINKDKIRIYEA